MNVSVGTLIIFGLVLGWSIAAAAHWRRKAIEWANVAAITARVLAGTDYAQQGPRVLRSSDAYKAAAELDKVRIP